MTGDQKTQPQELLEEVIGVGNDAPKFPTILEQEEHWKEKEAAEAPKAPRKWSPARRKRYNAKLKAKLACAEYDKVVLNIPSDEPDLEPVAMIKHCPFCGKNVERFLA